MNEREKLKNLINQIEGNEDKVEIEVTETVETLDSILETKPKSGTSMKEQNDFVVKELKVKEDARAKATAKSIAEEHAKEAAGVKDAAAEAEALAKEAEERMKRKAAEAASEKKQAAKLAKAAAEAKEAASAQAAAEAKAAQVAGKEAAKAAEQKAAVDLAEQAKLQAEQEQKDKWAAEETAKREAVDSRIASELEMKAAKEVQAHEETEQATAVAAEEFKTAQEEATRIAKSAAEAEAVEAAAFKQKQADLLAQEKAAQSIEKRTQEEAVKKHAAADALAAKIAQEEAQLKRLRVEESAAGLVSKKSALKNIELQIVEVTTHKDVITKHLTDVQARKAVASNEAKAFEEQGIALDTPDKIKMKQDVDLKLQVINTELDKVEKEVSEYDQKLQSLSTMKEKATIELNDAQAAFDTESEGQDIEGIETTVNIEAPVHGKVKASKEGSTHGASHKIMIITLIFIVLATLFVVWDIGSFDGISFIGDNFPGKGIIRDLLDNVS